MQQGGDYDPRWGSGGAIGTPSRSHSVMTSATSMGLRGTGGGASVSMAPSNSFHSDSGDVSRSPSVAVPKSVMAAMVSAKSSTHIRNLLHHYNVAEDEVVTRARLVAEQGGTPNKPKLRTEDLGLLSPTENVVIQRNPILGLQRTAQRFEFSGGAEEDEFAPREGKRQQYYGISAESVAASVSRLRASSPTGRRDTASSSSSAAAYSAAGMVPSKRTHYRVATSGLPADIEPDYSELPTPEWLAPSTVGSSATSAALFRDTASLGGGGALDYITPNDSVSVAGLFSPRSSAEATIHLRTKALPVPMRLEGEIMGVVHSSRWDGSNAVDDDTLFEETLEGEEQLQANDADAEVAAAKTDLKDFLKGVPSSNDVQEKASQKEGSTVKFAKEPTPDTVFNQFAYQETIWKKYVERMRKMGITVKEEEGGQAPKPVLYAVQHNPVGTGAIWDPFHAMQWWDRGRDNNYVVEQANCALGPRHPTNGVQMFVDRLGNTTFGPYACHPVRKWMVEYLLEKGIKKGDDAAKSVDRLLLEEGLKDPFGLEAKLIAKYGDPSANCLPLAAQYDCVYPPESGMKFTPIIIKPEDPDTKGKKGKKDKDKDKDKKEKDKEKKKKDKKDGDGSGDAGADGVDKEKKKKDKDKKDKGDGDGEEKKKKDKDKSDKDKSDKKDKPPKEKKEKDKK